VEPPTEITRANDGPLVAHPDATAMPPTEAAPTADPSDSPPWLVAGATLAGIMAIGIAGFLAARSKRQS
jgi:hypothetical protein